MNPNLANETLNSLEFPTWPRITSRIAAKNNRLAAYLAGGNNHAASKVLAAVESERERIARELHAGAGQPLSGMQINLEMVEEFVRAPGARSQAAATEALERLRHLASEASGQVRAVSHRLHPPQWQQMPLADALRHLIDSSGLIQRFPGDIQIDSLPETLSHQIKVAVYRCAQECIANAIRHSSARRVDFSVIADPMVLSLRVADNGKGFNTSVPARGLGLRALVEHAESVGGKCQIQSSAAGTIITVRIPLVEEL